MSYDLKCFELGWDFILAGEKYRLLDMEKVPSEDKHLINGLFKQATMGDIDVNYADRTGSVFHDCEIWEKQKGLSKPEAMKKYVEKCNEILEAYQS